MGRVTNSDLKGVLLVDKPSGMTSHDVVDRIRRATGIRRVGHTGTLDPAATGLLIICVGPATRLSEYLTGLDKVYEGYMRLGVVTDSHDMDGEVLEENDVPDVTLERVQGVFDGFTGQIEQVPPMVSAVKVGGQRLYKLARKGETVERKPRQITVNEFAALGYESPLVHFRVGCTSGTYVRSLCHDSGASLGCGATLDTLRRTAVGRHNVGDAAPLDTLSEPGAVAERLVPMSDALDLPSIAVNARGERIIASGGSLRGSELEGEYEAVEGLVQIKSPSGELLALGQVRRESPELQIVPKRVFSENK
jgi:tRNA pseudouridine55 synthase